MREAKPISQTQQALLDYCRKHIEEHQRPPSMIEAAKHFGWESPNATQVHVRVLRRHGLLSPSGPIKLLGYKCTMTPEETNDDRS